MKVNEIIKSRREELGYSLRDLSEKIGVNSSTIMRWENGDIANMKRDKIVSLAKALRISPGVIMGYEEFTLEKEEPKEALSPSKVKLLKALNELPEELIPEVLDYIFYKVHQYNQEHPEQTPPE